MSKSETRRGIARLLAARIIAELQARASTAGDHLVESALAQRFSVSRSPVRQALEVLAASGVVRQEPNCGYFLLKDAAELRPALARQVYDGAAQAPEDAAQALYLRISDDRLRGDLPQVVSEASLMRRYRAPRWLAQRALAHLAGHGLVRRRPASGWEFPGELTSMQAYEDGFSFRLTVEPAALREKNYRVPIAEWRQVRDTQRRVLDDSGARLSRVDLFSAGAAFHEAIVRWSGNRYFTASIRDLNQVRRLFEYRAKIDHERVRSQTREHLRILDLLAANEREAAARLLAGHIATALRRKRPLLARADGGR